MLYEEHITEILKNRSTVIAKALVLENTISVYLASLLNIGNRVNSISLGNKSSALSLNQKVGLLIDIGAIEEKQKAKFQGFMEIRNQMVHNLKAGSYVECFSFMEGKENWILRLYPHAEVKEKEEQLKLATEDLANEVIKIALEIVTIDNERRFKRIKGEYGDALADCMIESAKYIPEFFQTELRKESEKHNGQISVEFLDTIGERIKTAFLLKSREALKNMQLNIQNPIAKTIDNINELDIK